MARQISDVYIVESLLQSTEFRSEPLRWDESDRGGYASQCHIAQVGEVRIALDCVQGITGSCLYLTLSLGNDRVYVQEPESVGFLGRKYRCEDDRRLAGAIRQLRSAAVGQCRLRELRATENAETTRERVLSQLLFRGLEL